MIHKAGFHLTLLCISAVLSSLGGLQVRAAEGTVEAALNDVRITFDARTGGVRRLVYADREMLNAAAEQASIVDLAVPVEPFHALRLAARYSSGVQINRSGEEFIITWPNLGASRPIPLTGAVKVVVSLKPAADRKSVIMTCRIENNSAQPIRQVLFPDLAGLLPFAGADGTRLRFGGEVARPFLELQAKPETARFYAVEPAVAGRYEKAGDFYKPHNLRWVDFGGLGEGFSLWERAWGWDPRADLWVRRNEIDGKLRLSYAHDVTIEPKGQWQSGEFQLTPHRRGWAEGIAPLREWARQNVQRPYPLPRHVREGLGFRSVFLMRGMPPNTKEDIVYALADLPQVAADAQAHGLDELVPWFWAHPFQIPFHTLPLLGTDEEFARAVQQCRQLGVNVSAFISCYVLANPTAQRYGLKISPEAKGGGWTYHREMIPSFNPPYSSAHNVATAEQTNPQYQDDVFENCRQLIELGVSSLVWDVYGWKRKKVTPSLYDLTLRIRRAAVAKDPQSVFAAESCSSLELEANYIDYTWNWIDWRDLRACTSVLPAPRLNININADPPTVRLAFMDNLYMNLLPRKPGDVNGSALIADYPELGAALKQCAQLRRQFLPYFVEGRLIGECVLTEECPGMHVTAYVLPHRMLVIAMNQAAKRTAALKGDLACWLKSPSGRYACKAYDMSGAMLATATTSAEWQVTTKTLEKAEMVLYELLPE